MSAVRGFERRDRLQRCTLAVPAIRPELFEKAARSAADAILLDLEDSVAPEDKERARRHAVQGLNEVQWGAKTVILRVNAMDTPWTYRDLVDVLETCPRVDAVHLPKAAVPGDVHALDLLVTQIERAAGRAPRVGLEAMIESAMGVVHLEDIARASPRLESLAFGTGDYAASVGARSVAIGGPLEGYGMASGAGGEFFHWDPWHAHQSRLIAACRAYGLRAIDGPYGDYGNAEASRAAALRAAAIGFDGKWAIHPSQIASLNEVFTPSAEELARARRIVDALQAAARDGRGAVSLDGRMIDAANIRMAEALLAKARAAGLSE